MNGKCSRVIYYSEVSNASSSVCSCQVFTNIVILTAHRCFPLRNHRIRSNACVLSDYPELLTDFDCASIKARRKSGENSSAQVELTIRLSFDMPNGVGWILKSNDDAIIKEVLIGAYSTSQIDIIETVKVADNADYIFVLLLDAAALTQRGAYSVTQVGAQTDDTREAILLQKQSGPFERASEHTVYVGSPGLPSVQFPWLRGIRQMNSTVVPGTKITFRSVPGESNLYEFPDRAAYETCDFSRAKRFTETSPGQTVLLAREDGTRFFGADAKSCRSGKAKMILSVGGKFLQLHKRSKCSRTDGYLLRRNGSSVKECSAACRRIAECLGLYHVDSKKTSKRYCLLLPYRPLVEKADDDAPKQKKRRFSRLSCGVAT